MEALERANERAEGVLRELLRKKPDDILASTTLTFLLEAKGICREAEGKFKRAISSCSDEAERAYLHYCYLTFLRNQRRLSESEREICRAIELDRGEAVYLLEYTSLLEELGERRKSRKACMRAIRLLPHGDPIKKELKRVVKSDGSVSQILTPPPSAAVMLRFVRSHGEVLLRKCQRF